MRLFLSVVACAVIGASAVVAAPDSFSGNGPYSPPPGGLKHVQPHDGAFPDDQGQVFYDRIVAKYGHLGHDFEEELQSGPCEIKREWDKNGDFEQTIRCRKPETR